MTNEQINRLSEFIIYLEIEAKKEVEEITMKEHNQISCESIKFDSQAHLKKLEEEWKEFKQK